MENIPVFTSEEMLFIDQVRFVSSFSNGGEHLEPHVMFLAPNNK